MCCKGKRSGTKSVRFAMDPDSAEISLGSLEENGKLEEPPDSLEQDKTSKNGKYNLRKSLAWDSAFFTSAGTNWISFTLKRVMILNFLF